MQAYTVTHPQAKVAVWLSYKLAGLEPSAITAAINASRCPRSLYVLASVLRVATAPGSIINEMA